MTFNKSRLVGMVAYIYNPSYVEGRGRRVLPKDNSGKSERSYLKNQLKAKE
jgi:hypothetical protein